MKTNLKNRKTKTGKREPKQSRETLRERVHRHINDINSQITDDDIRNVRTELEIRSEPPVSSQPVNSEQGTRKKRSSSKQKKENETDRDNKQTTPWDLLSEGYD